MQGKRIRGKLIKKDARIATAYVLRFELFKGNRSRRRTVLPREKLLIAICTRAHKEVNVIGYKRSICNSVDG